MHPQTKVRITKEFFINSDCKPAYTLTLAIRTDEDGNLPMHLRDGSVAIGPWLTATWGTPDSMDRTRVYTQTDQVDTFDKAQKAADAWTNEWISKLRSAAQRYDELWSAVPDTEHETVYI